MRRKGTWILVALGLTGMIAIPTYVLWPWFVRPTLRIYTALPQRTQPVETTSLRRGVDWALDHHDRKVSRMRLLHDAGESQAAWLRYAVYSPEDAPWPLQLSDSTFVPEWGVLPPGLGRQTVPRIEPDGTDAWRFAESSYREALLVARWADSRGFRLVRLLGNVGLLGDYETSAEATIRTFLAEGIKAGRDYQFHDLVKLPMSKDQSAPDLTYVVAPGEGAYALRVLRSAGYRGTVLLGASSVLPDFFTNAGPDPGPTFWICGRITIPQEAAKLYQAKFGTTLDPLTYLGFLSCNRLLDHLENHTPTSAQELSGILSTLRPGTLGDPPLALYEARNGRWVFVQDLEPR